MRTMSTALTTSLVLLATIVLTGVAIRLADGLLGGLPGGTELVAWSFVASAMVASVLLSLWARSRAGRPGLAVTVMYALGVFALAAVITLAVWYGMFYSSGSYEKGGYYRLAAALGILIVGMVLSAIIGARVVANASLRDSRRIATVVALMLLTFLGSLAIPSLLTPYWMS